ncbi:glycosyltransferase [Chryseosolibacter indicus]|uniref:Glycosyltransferase n=1 Tax=Chryseosolibacter indicus TaxID=2782351 RepID=A0ABS5VP20_9BACT|nr:glycosyltransferase [Chryseosolibacter indicus]MBT1703180.1 glycosyltransferase [Chryseosolibacter indicus]
MKFSIVVPVYNRPQEVAELLKSLVNQTFKDFEVIILEDGNDTCEAILNQYKTLLNIEYYYIANSGPGYRRNFGMEKAKGEYIVLFDSDCLIPPDYFDIANKFLTTWPTDAFGGPDNAHPSFTIIQKAINYAMTSFVTTGGIRGKKVNLDNYQPRSFNMGLSKEVFKTVGGFSDIHPGEDPDLSYRILKAGFKVRLIEDAFVYHKRRIDFKKFSKQLYSFGVVRTILMKWYPEKFKIVYLFPSLFLIGAVLCILGAIFINPLCVTPILLLALIVFLESLVKSGNVLIAFWSIAASIIQLTTYGFGFLKGAWHLFLLRKNERETFPQFFLK